ncbi:hypothetical protein FCM35_KLT08976 [Carex littledalei]|uniref:Secreted protein n=1 Tax=Carex littledalei TaxID=544730 RepID=A0A833QW01_9POAL|nr:hypothetical protein FCM35_KLT08976 [Carex littledalei]
MAQSLGYVVYLVLQLVDLLAVFASSASEVLCGRIPQGSDGRVAPSQLTRTRCICHVFHADLCMRTCRVEAEGLRRYKADAFLDDIYL